MSDLIKALKQKTPMFPNFKPGILLPFLFALKKAIMNVLGQFKGTIIRIHGSGNSESFTVRRIASNSIGVERTFLTRSPIVEKVTVQSQGHHRRSRLYFLRERTGKKAKLRQKFN